MTFDFITSPLIAILFFVSRSYTGKLSTKVSHAQRQPESKVFSLKPGSHRKIVKDYRPKTSKDHDILRESVENLLKIV